jgi:peptide/nickel transport system ATP-binding protein/oligopeptide transport system ATP-binding protein
LTFNIESEILLEVKNLKTFFYTSDGVVKAVDGVSFILHKGETLGIVGESGCGKSVTAFSIMKLIEPPGKIESGEIFFEGYDILKLNEKELQKVRGNKISIIFQNPTSYLNPVFTCGEQIDEAITAHQKTSRKKAKKKTIELIKQVGITDAEQRYNDYPHQLSGGQQQRIMIAMALANEPKILIADEPTTALDVTIQTQILGLINEMKKKYEMSVILITHDMGVVAETCDNVAVMYASEIVEYGSVNEIFNNPKHPYTIALLESIPKLSEKKERLPVIEGSVPNPINYPKGCHFSPRCKLADEKCKTDTPPKIDISESHFANCFKIN